MAYRIRIRVNNPTTAPLTGTIYGGTLFEVNDPQSRVQNLVASADTPFAVPAGATQIIEVDSWCFNQTFAAPAGQAFSPTQYRTSTHYRSQQEVWQDQAQRR